MRKYLLSTSILAIIVCLLWSTAFFSIKIGLQYTSPLNFAGMRFILSGLFIVPFCGGLKKYFSILRTHYKVILKISLFQTFLLYSLFYLGIKLVPAYITAIVTGAGPLFIAMMAHLALHDDKLHWRKFLSILIGMTGVIIIAIDRFDPNLSEGKEFWGLLILIASNLCGGFGNVMISKNKTVGSSLVLNSAQMTIGGIAILLLSLPLESSVKNVYNAEYFVTLTWLSIVSAVAFSIWFMLLQRPSVKVSEVNIWKFLVPVFGAILSWIILPAEKPELVPVIGMAIIAVSLIVLNYNKVKALASNHRKKQ